MMYFSTALLALFFIQLSTVNGDAGIPIGCPEFEKFEYVFKVVQSLSDHDVKLKQMETKFEEIKEKVSTQEEYVSDLKDDLRDAKNEIEKLNEALMAIENGTETFPSNPKGAFVGFTAYLSRDARNLPVGVPIVLQETLLNEGRAYSTVTGKFTAPVSGYYSFTVVIESKNYGSCVIRMVVDGVNTLDVVVEPYHDEQNLHGVNAGIISLHAGQEVWIEPYQVNTPFLEGTDYYRFTTFSGVLLQKH